MKKGVKAGLFFSVFFVIFLFMIVGVDAATSCTQTQEYHCNTYCESLILCEPGCYLNQLYCGCGGTPGECWYSYQSCIPCVDLPHTDSCIGDASPNQCSCETGWGNCNNGWSDGCEANLLTDDDNCGSCGNVCGSNEECQNGQCVPTGGGGGSTLCEIYCNSLCKLRTFNDCYAAPHPFCANNFNPFYSCKCECVQWWANLNPPYVRYCGGNNNMIQDCGAVGQLCQDGACVEPSTVVTTCNSCEDCNTKLNTILHGTTLKLTADMTTTASDGDCIDVPYTYAGLFKVKKNIIIDCDGHKITGRYDGTGSGIRIRHSNGIIKNCEIKGFNRGIDSAVRSDSTTTILNNVIKDNNLGITVTNYTLYPLYGGPLVGDTQIEDNEICNNNLQDIKIWEQADISCSEIICDNVYGTGCSCDYPCTSVGDCQFLNHDLQDITFTTDCLNDGCVVGNEIILENNAEFIGDCSEINTFVIETLSINDCHFNIPFEGIISGGTFIGYHFIISYIPSECIGEEVLTLNALIYDSENPLGAVDSTEQGVHGSLIFNDILAHLDYINLFPDSLELIKGKSFEFSTYAHYEDDSTVDITQENSTFYMAQDVQGLNVLIQDYSYHWKFKANSTGRAEVTARFPVSVWNPNWLYKEDVSDVRVYEGSVTGCLIQGMPEVVADCSSGEPTCEEGEDIVTSFYVKKKCFLDHGMDSFKLKMVSEDFETCNFDFTKTVSYGETPSFDCDCPSGSTGSCLCEKEHTIPLGFFEQHPECEGETIFAYYLGVYDSANLLNYAYQRYFPGFGSIEFWSEEPPEPPPPPNEPPVAMIVQPDPYGGGQVGVFPVDGTTGYLLPATITFEDESYDPDTITPEDPDGNITDWYWYYKFGLGPWQHLGTSWHQTQQNHYSFTHYFEEPGYQPGNYRVRLNVTDNASAMDTHEKAFVLSDGETPLISISSPDPNLIQSRSVGINASASYDPPDKRDNLVFKWEFSDGSLTFQGDWDEASNFTHFLEEPLDYYEINLTLRDDASPPNYAYDQIQFRTWRCDDDGEILFADAQALSCFAQKPLYCSIETGGDPQTGLIEFPTDNCQQCQCPANRPNCNTQSGACLPNPVSGTCEGNGNHGDCHDEVGCWWETSCVSCVNEPPLSCSGYSQQSCEIDPCAVGYLPVVEGACGEWTEVEGIMYIIECQGCVWETGGIGCVQNYTLIPQNQNSGPGTNVATQTCEESRDYGSCDAQTGLMEVTIETECCIEPETGQSTDCVFNSQLHREDYSQIIEYQPCGLAGSPLPGFSWFNFASVLFLIASYYIIFVWRKNKKRG